MFASTLALALALAPSPQPELKSGPQVGSGVPGGFGTLFINGEHAGNRRCPV
jgi:hypothetical protein